MPTVLAEINAVLPQVISSIIIAGFTWGASQIVKWFKRHSQPATQPPQSAPLPPPGYSGNSGYPVAPGVVPQPMAPGVATAVTVAPRQVAPTLNWSQALLHIGILQLVVNGVGAVVGIVVALTVSRGALQTTFIVIQLIVGTLAAIVTFMLFGMRVARTVMWRHLTAVALGTVALTLVVNALLEQTLALLTPAAVIIALIQTFLAMGAGGALAVAMRPNPPAGQYPMSQPYGYNGQYSGGAQAQGHPPGYPPNYPAGYPPRHPTGGAGPGAPYPGGAAAPSATPVYPPSRQYPQSPPYTPGPQGLAYPPTTGSQHPGENPSGAGQTPPAPPQQL